jgi:hypothetical protein
MADLHFADVFIPKFWPGGNELLHQLITLIAVDDFQLDAAGGGVAFRALERAVLADDDFGDAVEQGGAAAHVAGGEGRVEDALSVVGGL